MRRSIRLRRITGLSAGQHADQRHLPADPGSDDRAGERAGAADLHDDVDAHAIGKPADLVLPIRMRAVIDAVGSAQRLGLMQLAVGGRGGDDARARRAGEL